MRYARATVASHNKQVITLKQAKIALTVIFPEIHF